MKIDDYQALAERTARNADGSLPAIEYLGLGLCGEAGEVADLIKKISRHGKAFDATAIADELGDVLWYIAILSSRIGLTLDEVASRNVEKLRRRYPDGFLPRGGGAEADAAAACARQRQSASTIEEA
jgi:NTP pyrophosphatase (non-canonical NTP hydrolase)